MLPPTSVPENSKAVFLRHMPLRPDIKINKLLAAVHYDLICRAAATSAAPALCLSQTPATVKTNHISEQNTSRTLTDTSSTETSLAEIVDGINESSAVIVSIAHSSNRAECGYNADYRWYRSCGGGDSA